MPEIPATRFLPRFMLEAGDMVFSQEDRWFFQCTYPGSIPDRFAGSSPHADLEVAIDPNAARDYNTCRRATTMAATDE